MERLQGEPDSSLVRLKEARRLPPPRFDEAQWKILEALVDVLPKAVAHLNLVFRARGRVDFAELSIRALDALGHLESPTDLALSLGYRIEHLLVDEFQDTSYTQYELLRKLTVSWEPGDGRTLVPGRRSHAVDLPLSRGGRQPVPESPAGRHRQRCAGTAHANLQLPLRSCY